MRFDVLLEVVSMSLELLRGSQYGVSIRYGLSCRNTYGNRSTSVRPSVRPSVRFAALRPHVDESKSIKTPLSLSTKHCCISDYPSSKAVVARTRTHESSPKIGPDIQ